MNDKRIFVVFLIIIAFILTALLILHEPTKDKININTATYKELVELPNIGDTLAVRIIKGRPYFKVEDIMKVKGIGYEIYKNLKDRLVIE